MDVVTLSAALGDAARKRPRIATPTWTKLTNEQARATSPTILAIGDSFTDNNHSTTTWNGSSASRTSAYRADGYLVWALVGIKQAVTWWDVGISGQTSADGIARFDTDVTPLRPQIVVEAFGSNDIGLNRTAEATFADKAAMWAKARGFGAKVITTTCPPRNTFTSAQTQEAHRLNTMLRNYAATNPDDFALVDWFPTFCDPLTGVWKGTLVDAAGVHPNTRGAAVVGLGPFATALRRFISETADPLPTSNVNDLDNMLTNPLMTGTTGTINSNRGITGSVPDGYTASSTGTDANMTSVVSKVARADGIGDWFQINNTVIPLANSYVSGARSARPGTWAVGDIVQGVIEFETDAAGWSDGILDLQLLATNGATILNIGGALGVGQDSIVKYRPDRGVLRTPPMVLPATTTDVRFTFLCGGLGVVRFGRAGLRKLPAAP